VNTFARIRWLTATGRSSNALLVPLAVALSACGSKGSSSSGSASANASTSASDKPVSSASAKPKGDELGATGPLKLTADGKALEFHSAIIKGAVAGKTLNVTISTNPALTCKAYEVGEDYMEFEVGRGPDGAFYPDQVVPLPLTVRVSNTPRNVRTPFAKLRLGTFKLGDEKVKLGLAIDYKFEDINAKKQIAITGGGDIDATICNDDDHLKQAFAEPKLPPAPDAPVSGKLQPGPFTMKKAFAFLVHDESMNIDYVSSVELFDSDAATCEKAAVSMFEGGGVDGVRVILHPGLTVKRTILGQAEPSTIEVNKQDGSRESMLTFGSLYGPVAVVTLDSADLKDGGSVKGRVTAATGTLSDDHKDEVGSVAGTFDAKICKRKW
jgi:hypothetical protein